MSNEDVLSNYNAIGIDVIERMYSDGYLSIGGDDATQELANLAGLSGKHRVLDVGSGLGGPARYLARTVHCAVTGLDLVSLNVTAANQMAESEGLQDKVMFIEGDATAMPFPDADFDVVWGQDAWCHIDEKDALIDESARVLRPGGVMAFSDWVVLGDGTSPLSEAALSAAASPRMASAQEYRAQFARHGLVIEHEKDLSPQFTRQYQAVMAGLEQQKANIVKRWSEKVFSIVAEKNNDILRGFESAVLGGVLFVARKPTSH